MKNIKFFLLGILSFVIFAYTTQADSVTLTGNTEFSGDKFTVDMTIDTSIDTTVIVFPLEYDKTKITLVDSVAYEDFKILIIDNILIDDGNKKGKFKIATLTFEATSAFQAGESTTITLKDGQFANVVDLVEVAGTNFTIKKAAASTPDTPDTPTYPTIEKNYTVTFNADNNTPNTTQAVKEGETVNRPADPIKTGYTFKGWYLNNALYDFSKPVTSNITLKAEWTANTPTEKNYTVTFNADNNTPNTTQAVKEGETVNRPADPIKTGYTFKGWYLNDALYDFSKPVTSNITLKAKWEANTPSEDPNKCDEARNLVVIKYYTNGGNAIEDYTYETDVAYTVLKTPTKTGDVFDGWYYDEALTQKVTSDNWNAKIASLSFPAKKTDPTTGCELDSKAELKLYAKWKKTTEGNNSSNEKPSTNNNNNNGKNNTNDEEIKQVATGEKKPLFIIIMIISGAFIFNIVRKNRKFYKI